MSAAGAWCAVLTAEGRGAISVLRVWGPDALNAVDRAFRPRRGDSLARTAPLRPRVGFLGDADEVVVLVIPVAGQAPEVEIHCHGGPEPRRLILETLAAQGVEPAAPTDWLRAGGASPARVEAWSQLAKAPTARTAALLLDQAEGAFDRAVSALRTQADLDALIAGGAIGTRLVNGWRIALAGRPNVGKSSLLNALAGYERAIVSPVPGTTRDVVTVRTALEGWPVELADTAGLRAATDSIEALGVAAARAEHLDADLVLLVLDRSEPLTAADRELLEALPHALVTANKADLPTAWDADEVPGAIAVSASVGQGIGDLAGRLAARLVPEPPAAGTGLPITPDQARWLESLRPGLDPAPARR